MNDITVGKATTSISGGLEGVGEGLVQWTKKVILRAWSWIADHKEIKKILETLC